MDEKRKFSYKGTLVAFDSGICGLRVISGTDWHLRTHFNERGWENIKVRVTVEEL